MAETIRKCVVLKIAQIEENTSIVTFFDENGTFSLRALGLSKINSKNRMNLQIGNVVEIEYFKARLIGSLGKLKKPLH
ncbi:recombination protein O N-terminal domain-containing protein [Mycoplasma corogypsi]|uniref:recombination protein O N-terminal domain-containing protein n=1 Tax=Mycoplasma corogypsi TaxID=2106 RepID=UPI0038739F69